MAKSKPIGPLALRYLAGTLPARAVAALKERIRHDPEARREFARILVMRAEMGEKGEVEPGKGPGRRGRPRS